MIDIDEFLNREIELLKKEKEGFEPKRYTIENEINILLDVIKDSIDKKEFSKLEKLYWEVQDKLAKVHIDKRMELYNRLIEINNHIISRLGKLSSEADDKSRLIEKLLLKIEDLLKKNDNDSASKLYEEAEDVYNEFPEEFPEKKKLVMEKMLDVYRRLNAKIGNDAENRFKNISDRLIQLLHDANLHIKDKDIKFAEKAYSECFNLYNKLPDGFLIEKTRLHNELLKLNEEIEFIKDIVVLQNNLTSLGKSSSFTDEIIKIPKLQEKRIDVKTKALDKKNNKQKEIKHAIEFKPNINIKNINNADINNAKIDLPLRDFLINSKKERAKYEIEKGFFRLAENDLNSILILNPNDDEAKSLLSSLKNKF